ncbi:MAG: hypothetical protein AAB589_00585 [Patescibacteria group bacterium]
METQINNEVGQKKAGIWWIILLLVIVVVAGGWWWVNGGSFLGGASSKYQAVFLSNNQVYFGKLSNSNSNYPKLTDIYYLQVAQPLQPSQPANNINLVKLGNELHGPSDGMKINRDHILFVEDLKADSQVVQAIEQYKKNQAAPATPAPTQ